jgi:hypothetical protein
MSILAKICVLVHEGDVDVALGFPDRLGASAVLIDRALNVPPLVTFRIPAT